MVTTIAVWNEDGPRQLSNAENDVGWGTSRRQRTYSPRSVWLPSALFVLRTRRPRCSYNTTALMCPDTPTGIHASLVFRRSDQLRGILSWNDLTTIPSEVFE